MRNFNILSFHSVLFFVSVIYRYYSFSEQALRTQWSMRWQIRYENTNVNNWNDNYSSFFFLEFGSMQAIGRKMTYLPPSQKRTRFFFSIFFVCHYFVWMQLQWWFVEKISSQYEIFQTEIVCLLEESEFQDLWVVAWEFWRKWYLPFWCFERRTFPWASLGEDILLWNISVRLQWFNWRSENQKFRNPS